MEQEFREKNTKLVKGFVENLGKLSMALIEKKISYKEYTQFYGEEVEEFISYLTEREIKWQNTVDALYGR